MSLHPDDHGYLYRPDHAERAGDLLLAQFKGKPHLEGFVSGMAAGAQQLEDTLWSVLIGTSTVQGAEGVHLDRWGAVVGEFRGGLTNAEYRRFLDLRVLANKTFPNEDLLYRLVDGALDAPTVVRVDRYYPRGLIATAYSDDFVSDAIRAHTAALVRDARPAGVWWVVAEAVPNRLKFDWEEDAEPIPALADADDSDIVISRLIYTGRGAA